jgi:ElaB/YqjD/DUF883 family membrane-anchored ribosome-binding protein
MKGVPMTELTEEIQEVLKEYTALQQEEQTLKERKHALQEKLKSHLRSGEKNIWYPEVDGVRLKVSCRSTSNVEYDEETLRARLGERYSSLLDPDIKKLRAELPNLGNELEPLLDRIGSPSPDKVKAAVENGTVSAEEFKGAFTKTTKEYISVSVLKNTEGSTP